MSDERPIAKTRGDGDHGEVRGRLVERRAAGHVDEDIVSRQIQPGALSSTGSVRGDWDRGRRRAPRIAERRGTDGACTSTESSRPRWCTRTADPGRSSAARREQRRRIGDGLQSGSRHFKNAGFAHRADRFFTARTTRWSAADALEIPDRVLHVLEDFRSRLQILGDMSHEDRAIQLFAEQQSVAAWRTWDTLPAPDFIFMEKTVWMESTMTTAGLIGSIFQ